MSQLPLVIAILAALASPSWARSEGRTIAYPSASVWATAVRFIAVDQRAKIVDRDHDAGYVMFEITDGGKQYRGSLEIVALTVDGNPSVKFIIDIADRPQWMELAMLKKLEQKVRAELGAPAPPKKKGSDTTCTTCPDDKKPDDKKPDDKKPDGR